MNYISEKEVEVASDATGSAVKLVVLEEDISVDAVSEDSVENLLPANAIILAVCYRVLTAISGGDGTAFSLGDPTTVGRFGTGISRAAGTNGVALTPMAGNISTAAAGPTQSAAAKVRITTTGGTPTAPTAGVVRVSVVALVFTAPADVA